MRISVAIPSVIFFGASLLGCGTSTPISSPVTPTALPQFSPAAGMYSTPESVSISDTTAGATIYYTTDGSAPSVSSPKYTSTVSVSTSTTIQAIAVTAAGTVSAIASAKYTITPLVTASPLFSPAAGTYSTTQTVTLSDGTPGAAIYYTTDGSTPTANSKQYSGAINVSSTDTIMAVAIAPQETVSPISGATYAIVPPMVTATAFEFGSDLVNTLQTKTIATVLNGGMTAAPVALSILGDTSFTLVPAQSCGVQVAANTSCPIVVVYDPTVAGTQSATVNVQFAGGSAPPSAISLTGTSLADGTVTTTINPQVALYTIDLPAGASATVAFGPDTSYPLETSARPAPAGGGDVGILVAGMKASSLYHMRATVTFADGSTLEDIDHAFSTGAIAAGIVPPITATSTPGMTPQPGIELIDTILGSTTTAAIATDLSGNVIWTYPFLDRQSTSLLYPIKLMPNGNLIMEIGPVSQSIVNGPTPAGSLVVLREIDLAGNTVQELSMAQLNARLISAGFTGLTLQVFSHDVTLLPNGHMLVITNTIRPFTNINNYPGSVNVVGDVIVDLDQDMNPVWVWNEFDHFDVNRQPMYFPDWTHSNAVVYSPDDGDFLVSIRHQNWVVKVNYNNGSGDGSVIWKLGYQGDFTLVNGTDPQDWFYAQHNPYFFSANTSGSFSLGLMDNGDDRVFADGSNCLAKGGTYCYTTVPVMQVDEVAKTATLSFHQILPTTLYSSFAGDTVQLPNKNIEYNLAGGGANSWIYEVTSIVAAPETVWSMLISGTNTYRAFRMPSLYPGVTW